MRLIDAEELMDHAGRDRLDSRELIMQMIENAPTVQDPRCEHLTRRVRELHDQNYSLFKQLMDSEAIIKAFICMANNLKSQ